MDLRDLPWDPELDEPPRPLPHLGALGDMPERDCGASPAPNVAVLDSEIAINIFEVAGQLDFGCVAVHHPSDCVDMGPETRVVGFAAQVEVVGENARELRLRRLTPVYP